MLRAMAAGVLLMLGVAGAAAEPSRIEFPSVTPRGPEQLLSGTAPPAVVDGILTLPDRPGRMPAVVIAHGSGGIREDREDAWARRLAAAGFATLVVNSFAPRGITSTGTDQSRVSVLANTADALEALRLLAAHPRIDPTRIAVMGFSRGGQVALYTALEPFRAARLPDGLAFAAHVALYPSCSLPYIAPATTGRPVLMLLGESDDYTPARHCLRYADWYRGMGSPVDLRIYAGAHHGFDASDPVRWLRQVQSARDCGLDIILEPRGGRVWTTGQAIPAQEIGRYIGDCMQRGAHFGGNAEALAAAVAAVPQFLRAAMGDR